MACGFCATGMAAHRSARTVCVGQFYGAARLLIETYGPAAVCAQLDIGERVRLNARQGVRFHLQAGVRVLDPETMQGGCKNEVQNLSTDKVPPMVRSA